MNTNDRKPFRIVLDAKMNRLLCAALVFSALARVSSGDTLPGTVPLGLPESHFYYLCMERERALSLNKVDFQLGSYSISSFPFPLGPFERIATVTGTNTAVFGSVREVFTSSRHTSARAYESLRAGVTARPSRNLFLWGNLVLDEQRAKDPTYTGKRWRGLAGDVEQAFVWYQNGGFTLQTGRFSSFWGAPNSLLLGQDAIMDGLAYSFRWGRVAFSYRVSKLDGLSPERSGLGAFENRYLAGHRVDLHLSRRLRIGVSEMVIFGGPGRQLEFAYLNPILFYHSSQLNDNADDNTLLGLDFDYRPVNRVLIYSQLLVDDFQVEKKIQSDQEPDEYGMVAGVYVADVVKTWDLKAEYSRVTNRTFNQPHPRNRYLWRNRPIGAALGNDYDLVTCSLIRWWRGNLRSSVNVELLRQGEGSPTDDWTTPWLEVTGDYTEPFPTGVVEKRTTFSAGFNGVIRNAFILDLTAGIERITNLDHRAGGDRTTPFLKLGLSAFFSGTVDVR